MKNMNENLQNKINIYFNVTKIRDNKYRALKKITSYEKDGIRLHNNFYKLRWMIGHCHLNANVHL